MPGKLELSKLKKEELMTLAKKEGVKVSEKSTKEELVQLITASQKKKDKPAAAKKSAPKTTKTVKAAPKTPAKSLTKTAAKPAAAKPVKKAAVKPAVKAEPVKKTTTKAVKTPAPKPAVASKSRAPALEGLNDTMSVENKKFEIEDKRGYYEPPYLMKGEESYELPDNYGDTKITLLIQDPYWVHAYWEINKETRKKYSLDAGNANLIIRVYQTDVNAHFDIYVNSQTRNWYFNVPQPNTAYYSEIGFFEKGSFKSIARSNVIMVPTDKAVPFKDDIGLTKERAEELFKQSGGYMIHKLVGSQIVSEWIAFPSGNSSGVSSGSGGISMPLPQPTKQRSFWAELHTELIVYGATEPTAKVTVGGVPIKLTPDGKFSIRFYLKDGEHSVPFVAVSQDLIDTIQITPFVTKGTERKEIRGK